MTNKTISTLLLASLLAASAGACGSDSHSQGTTPVMSSNDPSAEPAEPVEPAPPTEPVTPPQPVTPPEPPAPTYLHGKWVWFELESTNVEKSKAFLSGLLGWEIAPTEMGGMKVEVIKASGKDAGEIELREGKGAKSRWVPYVSVPDVDTAVKAVEESKGRVVKPAADLPEVGRYAVVADDSGAVFGVFKGLRSDEPDSAAPPAAGAFVWSELMTKNESAKKKSLAFYSTVVGYTSSQMQVGEGKKKVSYDMMSFAEKPRAGVKVAKPSSIAGHWLPWVTVDDVNAIPAKVKELKGRVLLKPHDIPTVGRGIIIADPTGAPLALLKPLTPEEQKAAMDAAAAAAADKAAKEQAKADAKAAKEAAKAAKKGGKAAEPAPPPPAPETGGMKP